MPASLRGATIKGVRSYSPQDGREQKIEFMPLTLIVGANGTGKTTIIEALKFIISGEEPPHSDSRRNFIHTTNNNNPVDTSKSCTYASIELEFQNTSNQICMARREITKAGVGKNTTPMISSSYKIGKRPWTHVNKQEDWNKTMPVLFNLPNQAILNNVVLCHQEENLWCMGDSAKVKEIFDKIFGCEQYKKEIKYIDAEIKTSNSELTLGERDLQRLKDKVERKKNLEYDIERLKNEIERLAADSMNLDGEIKKENDRKSKIASELQEIESRGREAKVLEQRKADLDQRLAKLSKSLAQPPIDPNTTSYEELEQKVQDHHKFVDQQKSRQIEIRNSVDKLKREIRSLELKRSSIQVKELALVDGNLTKMSTIVDKISPSEHVVQLKSLIDSTTKILKGFMKQMRTNDNENMENFEGKFDELDNLKEDIEVKHSTINDLFKLQSSLSEELGQKFESHEENKKNLQILDLMKQMNTVIANIKTVSGANEDDVSKLKQLNKDLDSVERKLIELRDKRSMIAGTRLQMDRESMRLKMELESLLRAKIDYAECLGKVSCNKIVAGDLAKLKECFKQSIITFHDQMIAKINEVLRARWKQIYQGSDIETIELVDEEVVRGKDKKSINYYIALRKNGIRMKMREKSSAGQKALASIILRMTLAELFVKDFAFIALDEPTANLDIANVKSLAKSIGSYVKRRSSKGANIQWIIITHDEQFLKALDTECSPYYYRTQLDASGNSEIVKISSLEVDQATVESQ